MKLSHLSLKDSPNLHAILPLLCFLTVATGQSSANETKPPNIILIMADDLGFSDLGCYGGEIQTPNLDQLATNGIRFSQFYNTGRCWPTRASLLTGYYPHGVRRDTIPEVASGNRGKRPSWSPLITEALKSSGYRSYHSGKWHLDGMPIESGFDRSYHLKDQHRFFNPTLHWEDDQALPSVPKHTNFYATHRIGDHVIRCLTDHFRNHRELPFFHYVAFTAPHFPLQAPQKDIEKYRDSYSIGWDRIRQIRWNKLQTLGLVRGKLSKPMTEVGPPYDFPEAMAILGSNEVNRPIPWDSLSQSQKDFQSTKMAIHAAMIDCMDREIGRLVSYIKEQNELDNTLIFFLSDNGASAEIMVRGDGHDSEAPLGSADSHLCLGPGWSTAANTPFRYHKTWTYEGGTASPLIVFWPKGIRERGEIRDQVSHVIDLWPTILEVAGVNYQIPASQNYQRPGKSLTQQFASSATEPRTLWWLHEGNRALRHGDWKINMEKSTGEWELYHLKTDRTEMSDVAEDHPGILSDLSNRWKQIYQQQALLAEDPQ